MIYRIEICGENNILKSIRAQKEAIDKANNEYDKQVLSDTLSILIELQNQINKN